jgi:hypothetical protein
MFGMSSAGYGWVWMSVVSFRGRYRFLKLLSSDMDEAKSMFIRKLFIKERGAEVFRKISPAPIL